MFIPAKESEKDVYNLCIQSNYFCNINAFLTKSGRNLTSKNFIHTVIPLRFLCQPHNNIMYCLTYLNIHLFMDQVVGMGGYYLKEGSCSRKLHLGKNTELKKNLFA